MGMDHYGSTNWKVIHENLLPVKTPKQVIYSHNHAMRIQYIIYTV